MSTPDYRESESYKKGIEVYAKKYEPHRMKLLESMHDFSPELADVLVSHGLCDIWVDKTPNLTVQEKEIAVLASLITSGTVHSEIKAHAQCLLNVGFNKEKIKERLILMTLYVGVPKVVVAKQLIEEAFNEYDAARINNDGNT
jgi:4-carboxymuconolactone decarboxylase